MGMLGFFKKKEVPDAPPRRAPEDLADPEFPQSPFTTPAAAPGEELPMPDELPLGEPGHGSDHRDDLDHVPDFSEDDIAAAAKHDMASEDRRAMPASDEHAAQEPLLDPALFDEEQTAPPPPPERTPLPPSVDPPAGRLSSSGALPQLDDTNPFGEYPSTPADDPVPTLLSTVSSPTPDWAADPEPAEPELVTPEPVRASQRTLREESTEFDDLPPLPTEQIDRHYIPLLEYKTAFERLGDLRKTVARSQATIKKVTQEIGAQRDAYDKFADSINALQQQLIQMDDVLLNKR